MKEVLRDVVPGVNNDGRSTTDFPAQRSRTNAHGPGDVAAGRSREKAREWRQRNEDKEDPESRCSRSWSSPVWPSSDRELLSALMAGRPLLADCQRRGTDHKSSNLDQPRRSSKDAKRTQVLRLLRLFVAIQSDVHLAQLSCNKMASPRTSVAVSVSGVRQLAR